MRKPTQPSPNLIVTEGKDDVHVIKHLLAHHQIPEGIIDFKSYEGIDPLLKALPTQLRESGLKRLGIVVDADVDLANRWEALRYRLREAGFDALPLTPSPAGTLIQMEDKPVVGVWLMPNNQLPGMLEDFVGFLVPSEDALWRHAHASLLAIPEDQRKFKAHLAKAHIHTWLAWQEEPGTPLGSAITKRYLDANADCAQRLIVWVRNLFELS